MVLIKCVVLLMSVILIHGEDLTDECRFNMLNVSYEADACIETLQSTTGSIEQLIEDFNQTVIHYNGNDVDYESVDPLINKFLNVLPKFCDCSLLIFNYSGECPRTIESRVREIFIKQIAAFAYLAQEDNGEKVKKLIPHNGLQVLLSNDDIEKCVKILRDIGNMDELCSAIGRAHQCAVQAVGNHPNENVLLNVKDFTTTMKQANNC